jgi:DNA repair protein RadC
MHNHPGGQESFSMDDIEITDELNRMLSSVGVKLIDHFLITRDKFISARNLQLLV